MLVGAHTFSASNGYGRLARNTLDVLLALNFNVKISPGMVPIPEDLKKFVSSGVPNFLVYPPFTEIPAPFQYTTYESTKLPKRCVELLNKRKLVIVPCHQNAKMCRDSGVRKPVVVIHPFVKACYVSPAPMKPFTFLHIGADSSVPQRKRTEDTIKAFLKAFPVEPDVRLIVKKDKVDNAYSCFDKRVEIIQETLPSLFPLYEQSHVGVFPSGQEGWGYCHADMMSCGRPVMTPLFGGPADFCDATCSYPLPFTMKKVPKPIYGGIGECAHVGISDIIKTFRWCYENKEDTILKGVLAYRKMLGFSFTRMIAAFDKIFQ